MNGIWDLEGSLHRGITLEDIVGYLTKIDWRSILQPTLTFPEAFIRISAVYLTLYMLLRLVLKREAGALGITDLLVIVLLADAVQNAMADEYTSVTDGLVLAVVLISWDWCLSFLAFRWRKARKILRPAPLLLVRDGKPIDANLRKELITDDELMSEIRLQGVNRLEDVEYAFLEADGRVSVVQKENEKENGGNQRKTTA